MESTLLSALWRGSVWAGLAAGLCLWGTFPLGLVSSPIEAPSSPPPTPCPSVRVGALVAEPGKSRASCDMSPLSPAVFCAVSDEPLALRPHADGPWEACLDMALGAPWRRPLGASLLLGGASFAELFPVLLSHFQKHRARGFPPPGLLGRHGLASSALR